MAGGIEWLPSWNGVETFDRNDEPADRSYVGIGIYFLGLARPSRYYFKYLSLLLSCTAIHWDLPAGAVFAVVVVGSGR